MLLFAVLLGSVVNQTSCRLYMKINSLSSVMCIRINLVLGVLFVTSVIYFYICSDGTIVQVRHFI